MVIAVEMEGSVGWSKLQETAGQNSGDGTYHFGRISGKTEGLPMWSDSTIQSEP